MTGMKPYASAAGAALAILLAGCHSPSPPPEQPRPCGRALIWVAGIWRDRHQQIHLLRDLTVKPGQKVTVTNQDSVVHTLTDKKSHLFDTGDIAASGGKGTFTAPTKPGRYPFGCTIHPDMQGTLIVKS